MRKEINRIVYILSIIAISLSIYIIKFYPFRARLTDVIILFTLALILEAFPVEIPGRQIALSMGFIVSYTGILMFGAPIGILLNGLGSISLEELNFKSHDPKRFIFNRANLIICAGLAGLLYEALNGLYFDFGWRYFLVALSVALVYWFSNVTLLSLVVSVDKGRKFVGTLIYYLSNISIITYLLHFFLALVIAQSYKLLGPVVMPIYIVPIFIARYLFILASEVNRTYDQAISTLIKLLGVFDSYTSSHSLRVAQLSEDIAREMGLSEARIERIRNAALLHDLGKIGLSLNILNKPDKLTKEEWLQIYKHPIVGEDLSKEISRFKEVPLWIRHHHEKYNGNGYPDGLRGEEIPLESRIIACADAFDAITTDRPYSKRKGIEEAKIELYKSINSQLDPEVVSALFKVLEKNSSLYNDLKIEKEK
ncbi:MAG: HD domain-containing protein [bacterium]|nr:HD domain-containing protein [bacterium]